MKKKFTYLLKSSCFLFLALYLFSGNLKAQNNIVIQDTSFARILRERFPTCINGNLMDTTCADLKNASDFSISSNTIVNLNGIQFLTGLKTLFITGDSIAFIPSMNFPNLMQFGLNGSKISKFPTLNFPNLITLALDKTLLKDLSNLNFPLLDRLNYTNNSGLTTLPHLPFPNLRSLNCFYNSLTSLNLDYPLLEELLCMKNQLDFLPPLPNTLCSLNCDDNRLMTLPALPFSLKCGLECRNNKITCFPIFPTDLAYIDLAKNPFTCLPNHINSMDTSLLAYPICKDGDAVNNPYNCAQAKVITGFVYKDENTDCNLQPAEGFIKNMQLKLYNNNAELAGQTTSLVNGSYKFTVAPGTYKVKLDVTSLPLTSSCKIDSMITISNSQIIENVNFGVKCKTGYDIGLQSITTKGLAFPGQPHILSIIAGDMSNWYNANCLSGKGGTVEVKITGPVVYSGVPVGALTPIVSGNVLTYTIADFSAVSKNVFALNLVTNTSASAGNLICVEVHIASGNGDIDLTNNDRKYCYTVVNSHDPNIKEVYPTDKLEEGYKDWLTYTIHFQNTGNAPAINIALTDTLSPELDLETFQITNYSHYNETSLIGNAARIKFPVIQLPDSTSNPEGSKGFVQYRIKPKPNLPAGTVISNRAFIYFDYNAPIITNTTLNHFVKTVSVEEKQAIETFNIFPNPGNGNYILEIPESMRTENYEIEIYNVLGSLVYSEKTTADLTFINLTNQPKGIYFIKIAGKVQSFSQHIIKQ